METDLIPGSFYDQGLVIERPVVNGRYTVHARLMFEGERSGPEVVFDVVADGWPL